MVNSKKALITGITGQDGSYLAEHLLECGYEVHGLKRRASSFNTSRIDHLYFDYAGTNRFFLHYGDLSDSLNLVRLLADIRPDEVYNLGAQSHVSVSFESPEYTADVDALGVLRLLEGIRFLGLTNCRFYQASTSELFGKVQSVPQSESTRFYPRSPYAVAKLYGYWITVNYREAYGMHASNGILFNHESSRRGETFVTRKITRQLSRIICGLETELVLGNLDALRDWGHARDYMKLAHAMLQLEDPVDLVIATGQQMSVRDFVSKAADELGLVLGFEGNGISEVGRILSISEECEAKHLSGGQILVRVHEKYYRPAEVDTLLGDSSVAKTLLPNVALTSIDDLISEMVETDLEAAKIDKFTLEKAGGRVQ